MHVSEPRTPELLAPAGGPDSLRAAAANGADAVYLGVDRLNARRGAQNFTLDSLAKTCRFAHLAGVRVYLTVNVLVLPDELAEALDLVDRAWAAGVDAVIVQDLGLLSAVHRALPDVRIHASTQLNTHNTPTVRVLRDLGVSRVTLAREVSIDEIAGFVSASEGVQIETFVHGALCMCYSGQCLMSSLIGRRSANRGLCAQPCRLPYELVGEAGEVIGAPGAHLLSPKDLAGISVLPQLVESGVAALKIEGRMKSPEYVALVTGVYRAALDRALSDAETYRVRDGETAVLAESFSRGFSEAYLLGERGNDMMSYRRPNNRGVPVGRVSAVAAGRATINLDAPLEAADTIEFWTSCGRFAQEVGTLEYAGAAHASAPAGARASVAVEGATSSGDRVFRVRNAALAAAAQRTFSDAGTVVTRLDFAVRVVVGQPLWVEVRDESGRAGAFEGAVVEPARTKSVTAEEVAEHVGRLGGTPYDVGGWDLTLSPGAGIGFSALHAARREAIGAYERGLLAPWAARELAHPVLPAVGRAAARGDRAVRLVASVEDVELVQACLDAGADVVEVAANAISGAGDVPQGAVPVLPRIVHDREVARLLRFVRPGQPLVVANLGLLGSAAESGAVVEAHWSLNAVNALAVGQLSELGAQFVWLSPELSGRQLAQVAGDSPVPVGTAVYGRQEVMVTEHCILMAEGECSRHCATCDRRASRRVLCDRKGYEFPLYTDVTGRSHLFNSVPLDLTGAMSDVLGTGVSAVRVDLTFEGTRQAREIVGRVREALTLAMAGLETSRKSGAPATSGHFFRGVL